MNTVNEEYFNQAVTYMNGASNDMDDAASVASQINVPSDFEESSVIEDVIAGISDSLKSKIDDYGTNFKGLISIVERLIEVEKNAEAGAADLTPPEIIKDLSGNSVGFFTSKGAVSLESFSLKVTDAGTYYTWKDGLNSNILTPCDIFVPNVEKITGLMIYLPNDQAVKALKNGEVRTSSIVMIPAEYLFDKDGNHMYQKFAKEEAQQLVKDAQNIAETFGADPKNLSIYGFSAAGGLAASIVEDNEHGTFKSVVFSSTRFGVNNITDESVKVISIIGQHDGENGVEATKALNEFADTHLNDTETFTVAASEEIPKVSHMFVTEAALKSQDFNGMNIFDYALSDGDAETVSLSATGSDDIIDIST